MIDRPCLRSWRADSRSSNLKLVAALLLMVLLMVLLVKLLGDITRQNQGQILTLPGVNARGFLIQRLTFKLRISFEQSSNLSTVKRHQLTSLTYSNPRGSISKSVLGYSTSTKLSDHLEFGRAPPYLLLVEPNYVFSGMRMQ